MVYLGPVRASPATRIATTMAPVSNKPPPPSRKKIDVGGGPSVSDAKAAFAAQGVGMFGAPLKKTGGLKKPAAVPAPSATKSPASSPRVVAPAFSPRVPAPSPPIVKEEPPAMMARAVYEYAGTGAATELLFPVGAEISIIQKDTSGWWEGTYNGASGWFPAEFVEDIEVV